MRDTDTEGDTDIGLKFDLFSINSLEQYSFVVFSNAALFFIRVSPRIRVQKNALNSYHF